MLTSMRTFSLVLLVITSLCLLTNAKQSRHANQFKPSALALASKEESYIITLNGGNANRDLQTSNSAIISSGPVRGNDDYVSEVSKQMPSLSLSIKTNNSDYNGSSLQAGGSGRVPVQSRNFSAKQQQQQQRLSSVHILPAEPTSITHSISSSSKAKTTTPDYGYTRTNAKHSFTSLLNSTLYQRQQLKYPITNRDHLNASNDAVSTIIHRSPSSSLPLARSRRHFANAQDSRQSDCNDNRPAIYGLRCDEGGEVKDGVLVIKAHEPTQMFLIGRHLDANLSVALTPTEGSPQDDCTHTDRVKSLQIHNLSSNIAQVIIDLPSPGSKTPFYLCLRESRDGAGWFHQGSEAWLKIYVKQDFLPLYMKIIVIACLLMLSGLFSGLNLGLMALDKNELQVIISCGTETEKRYARAIEPVRRRGNYLLCSILFSNVLVNSTIAVLLEELTSGIVAVMTSTIFIVMFGEILPQAFCSRHGLAVGAKTVSLTYFCMIVTFPLSYPVSSCLDWALGEEIGHAYDRERLMEFIKVTRDYNNLETDEVNIISGALKLKRIQLSEVMTRIEDVYMLDVNSCLDFDTIQAIIERGYSRVPVHEAGNKKNIVALLFAKDLALLDPDNKTPVKTLISFYDHPIMHLFEDTTLDLALNEFKTGKSHMAFVRRVIDDGDRDPIYEITGIVTLEDVIEEIMQMEINDETDTLSDNRRKRRRKEAQVRKDFSQFTNLGAGDSSHNVVTPQLCLAAYQYLATTVEPFSSKFISDSILKRLLSQKIYYKVRLDDYQVEKRLYTAGESVDYFIMILEGRVHVVCGKESLVFDGGPFSCFGKAALSPVDRIDSITTNNINLTPPLRKESLTKHPLLNNERRESVAVGPAGGKTLNGQFSISMKKLEQSVSEADSNMTVTSASGLSTSTTPPGGVGRLKSSDSRTSVHSVDKVTSHFIPDYTIEIVANTSYLKITRNEYLTALRATLVERGCAPENESTNTDDQPNVN